MNSYAGGAKREAITCSEFILVCEGMLKFRAGNGS